MKRKPISRHLYFFLSALVLCSCSKNETQFYTDDEQPRLAIFSNKSNNILSCLIDGKSWRTPDRTTSGFIANTRYEVYIDKQTSSNAQDTLLFSWTGYYINESQNGATLILKLPVAKDFSVLDLDRLALQRIQVDTTNGYFSSSIPELANGSVKAAGNIYFHTAQFDSIGIGVYAGKISGLFDADFYPKKITSGRFDHFIEPRQIHF